jgi:hypothetical protein
MTKADVILKFEDQWKEKAVFTLSETGNGARYLCVNTNPDKQEDTLLQEYEAFGWED